MHCLFDFLFLIPYTSILVVCTAGYKNIYVNKCIYDNSNFFLLFLYFIFLEQVTPWVRCKTRGTYKYFGCNNAYGTYDTATSPQATLRRRRCLRYHAGTHDNAAYFGVTAHRCDSAEKRIVEYTRSNNFTAKHHGR